MVSSEDTISAIATPLGVGSIAVIRISGNLAENILKKIFRSKKKHSQFISHKLYYGTIVNPYNNELIDDVLVTVMKSPYSYTGEDVVEIHCHGGNLVTSKILELVLKNGARLAEPGEFTKRAFLNNKLDLIQAEAVIDVINAKTDKELNISQSHLHGELSKKIYEIHNNLSEGLALLEAEIDFPEEDIGELKKEIEKILESAQTKIKKLLLTYEEGKILTRGIKVAIIGKPNVGKSSLLNAILKEKRAIVTDIPGTTRDVIEESVNIRGIPITLIDTAGIQDTDDIVEKEGITLTKKKIKEASVILYMTDVLNIGSCEDSEILEEINNKEVIFILNKIDLLNGKNLPEISNNLKPLIKMSLLKDIGLEELKDKIFYTIMKGKINSNNDILLTKERHKDALEKALTNLEAGILALKKGLSYEFIAFDIRNSLNNIGEIVGITPTEEILDIIFSRFCIGK